MMVHRLLTSRLILFTFQNFDRKPDVYFQFSHFANQVKIMDLTKAIKWYYADKQLHAIEGYFDIKKVSFKSCSLTYVLLILGRQLQIVHQIVRNACQQPPGLAYTFE